MSAGLPVIDLLLVSAWLSFDAWLLVRRDIRSEMLGNWLVMGECFHIMGLWYPRVLGDGEGLMTQSVR